MNKEKVFSIEPVSAKSETNIVSFSMGNWRFPYARTKGFQLVFAQSQVGPAPILIISLAPAPIPLPIPFPELGPHFRR